MTDVKSMTKAELAAYLGGMGEKPFRAKQLYEWLQVHRIRSYEEATNLPTALRKRLSEEAPLTVLAPLTVQRSRIDNTAKTLFALPDGEAIESVAMHYRFGLSVCVSSQAGCDRGCIFCASGIGGLSRNLSASEMLEQVYAVSAQEGEAVKRVVVMGSGEPFLNYENLHRFLTILTDKEGFSLGTRHVTVSTCGIVPRILDFARDFPQAGLAVSLHAPTQEKRERIMPRAAGDYGLEELIGAARKVTEQTGRKITFEYALIGGLNDGEEDARALAALLKGMLCVVNLIPVNPVTEKRLREPNKTDVREFKKNLETSGINVTIRREMGRDIDGACGQLRHRSSRGERTC